MKTGQVRLIYDAFRAVLTANYMDLEAETIDNQTITPNRLFCKKNHPNIIFCKKLPFSAISKGEILMQILYRKPLPTLPDGELGRAFLHILYVK